MLGRYNTNVDFDYFTWSNSVMDTQLKEVADTINYTSKKSHQTLTNIVKYQSEYKASIESIKNSGKGDLNKTSFKLIQSAAKLATNLHAHGDDENADRLLDIVAHAQIAQTIINKKKDYTSAEYTTRKKKVTSIHTWAENKAYEKRKPLVLFQIKFVTDTTGFKTNTLNAIKAPGDIKVKPPTMLVFLANYIKVSDALLKGLEVINSSMKTTSDSLISAASKMFAFGDLKSGPLYTLIGVMDGYNQIVSFAFNVGATVISGADYSMMELSEAYRSKDKVDAEESSSWMFKSISKTVALVLSGISSLTKMITMTFELSFTSFITILDSIFKVLKSLVETSEVLKSILSIVDLIVTIFFFPFFIAFGTPLIEALASFVGELASLGVYFGSWFLEKLSNDTEFQKAMAFIVDNFKTIGVEFLNTFLPQFIPLVEPMIQFAIDFVSIIIANADEIFDMLEYGIEAYTTMVKSNLLQILLEDGVEVFKWMIANSDTVLNIIEFLMDFCMQMLRVIHIVISDLEAWTLALLMGIGALAGAIAGAYAGAIGAVFTFGLSVAASAAAGAILGTAAGTAAYWYIYDQIFKSTESFNYQAFALGGKVRPRVGGLAAIIAEAGEGEYIIPESKTELFRGNNNLVIRFKGTIYKPEELQKVIDEMNLDSACNAFFN